MRRQEGQAIVLIALMLTVLIGMVAIAIDGSRAFALRRDLQAAVDAASLAGGDNLQQTGSWTSAEQVAASIFATNLRLYTAPACSGWGSPGAAPWTVTCTYSDNTVLTEVAQRLGPQGGQLTLSARRNLQLQFARILTNGTSPALAASSTGNVNNLRYTPAIAALGPEGCGGISGATISISGSGTLNVNGDIVANGAISLASASMRVAGDIYARCQSPVPGSVTTACYPSGASTPCGYPDVAGATRSGFNLADPGYPPPTVTGSGQGLPSGTVVVPPGVYSSRPVLNGGQCWFLSGGVYDFQVGVQNLGDFVSNELKPPDEPDPARNTSRSSNQFWDTNGVNCSGSYQLSKTFGIADVPVGQWAFVVTSVRTDVYNGVTYQRESAPSMCQQINVNTHFDAIQLTVSNVPGARSYNIYAAPPGNGCAGPFGLAANLSVSGSVQNTNTNSCPQFNGNGCSLGHESILLDAELVPPFAPNCAAAPGTSGACPPDPQTAPLAFGLPNQNPGRAAGARGDRANENNCVTTAGAFASCPAAITPGAVELYLPGNGCIVTSNGGDTYIFSGYQYNWVAVYEPPSNTCSNNVMGANRNSAYIGLVYAPASDFSVTSPYVAEAVGVGGLWADTVSFSGTLPSITYSSLYAPVPPASRLTG
ncbi:MAG TPA: pilus assembly protein TadG-related protein [Candidatus Limnocylindrales bacterium]|nr:pilus assembly protein TadG-related protein [Candidatus Limnocylindrales bacterium]